MGEDRFSMCRVGKENKEREREKEMEDRGNGNVFSLSYSLLQSSQWQCNDVRAGEKRGRRERDSLNPSLTAS